MAHSTLSVVNELYLITTKVTFKKFSIYTCNCVKFVFSKFYYKRNISVLMKVK